MSTKFTDRDYLFLTSLLRAREANMLTGERLEQMLAAGSFAEAAKLLSEAGWPDLSELDRSSVDAALTERREAIFAELARMAPQPEVVDLFRVRYDYHNAKTIIKGEGAGVAAGHLISGAGRVSREKLEQAFTENDYRFVPNALGHAMREAKGILARTGNPQLCDFVLDRACYAEMRQAADSIGSPFVSAYVTMLIDGANLRTGVRCARMQKDQEFVKSALIPGGSVSVERLAQSVSTGEGITGLFATTAYKDAAVLGGEALRGGRMTEFELACDNTVNRYLSDARRMSFGPEAAVGYLAAEESNITAVRMVLTGLLAGIDPARLKERLRDSYV